MLAVPTSLTLGTVVTAAGCYVPGWGRVFTVTTTFAVLPPLIFRSYGISTTPGDPSFYRRTPRTTGDIEPLIDFSQRLTAVAAGTGFYSSLLSAASATYTLLPDPTVYFRTLLPVSAHMCDLGCITQACATHVRSLQGSNVSYAFYYLLCLDAQRRRRPRPA